jgi:hypothetical protein
MAEADIQYVSNESGEPATVIVPISLWRDIASERETACLLKSESMKRRLLEAKERQQGLSLDETMTKLGIWRRRVRGPLGAATYCKRSPGTPFWDQCPSGRQTTQSAIHVPRRPSWTTTSFIIHGLEPTPAAH